MIITYDDFDKLTEQVAENSFKMIDWYPTIDQIREHITEYNEKTIAFLLWCVNTEMELSEDDKKTKRYIQQLLYDEDILNLVDEKVDKESEDKYSTTHH